MDDLLEAKVGEDLRAIDLLGNNPAREGEIGLHELLKGGGVRSANDGEDVGNLACALAFAGKRVGDLGRANLERLLCRRKPEVVERLARLAQGKDDLGLLASLGVGGEGRSGLLGGGGDVILGHGYQLSFMDCARGGMSLAGMESRQATLESKRKAYFFRKIKDGKEA